MSGLVMYTCPLKIGRLAHLYLPSDVTQADIDRIVAMLRTLPPTQEKTTVCADGLHWAESLIGTHRRCERCGHEWEFPAARQVGSSTQTTLEPAEAPRRSESDPPQAAGSER